MKRILLGVILVGAVASAASAGECPMLQAQVDKEFGKRFDNTAAAVKSTAAEGMALHQAGKHAESVMKYEEAAKAGGITLQRKK
jgi:hypothetical protein